MEERIVFDTFWFRKHQKGLLFLLNAPVIKYWFRWILRITPKELAPTVPFKRKIIGILPNAYTVDAGLRGYYRSQLLKTAMENPLLNHAKRREAKALYMKIKRGRMEDEKRFLPSVTTTFFPPNVFRDAILHTFYPIWFLMHCWDLLVDMRVPALSFGFSTLNATCASGTESGLGRLVTSETWGTIRAGAGTHQITQWGPRARSSTTSSQWAQLWRHICTWDTSSLGSSATVSSGGVTAGPYITDKQDPATAIALHFGVYDASPASNTSLAASDYSNCGTTAYATAVAYASINLAAYNSIAGNSTFEAAISKTSYTRASFRDSGYDVANSAPTWTSNKDHYYTTDEPTHYTKLDVTYTTSTAWTKTLTETLSDADTLTKLTSMTLTEMINDAASLGKSGAKALAETLHGTDELVKNIGKALSETIYSIDVFTKQAAKNLLETMIHILTFSTEAILYRTLDESITDGDTVSKETSKTFSETNHIADILAREITKVLTEAINYAAEFYKQSLKNLTEIIAYSDTLLLGTIKVLAEGVSYAGSLVKETAKSFAEAIVSIANINILSNFYRTMTETLMNLDFIAFQKTMFKMLAELVYPIDALIKLAQKALIESFNGIDALSKKVVIVLSEAVQYIDSLIRQEIKVLTETASFIGMLFKSTTVVLGDAIHHTDAISKQSLKNFMETVHGVASLTRQGLKVMQETTHYTDIIIAKIFFKVFSETLHAADSISKTLARNFKETFLVADRLVGRILESLKKVTLKLATKVSNILKLKI